MEARYDTGGGDRLARSAVNVLVVGSSGAAEPERRSSAYLIGDSLAIDAGSLASGLSLERARRIRTVLLTHSHFDHIRELPLFLDNVYRPKGPPVEVGLATPTREALLDHIFNGRIWPDVRCFAPPGMELFEVKPGRELVCEGFRILPIRLRHTVPTVGYILRRARKSASAAAILGDTGYSEGIFTKLAAVRGLDFLLIETSYPNRLPKLAETALHLTPDLLSAGLAIVRKAHTRLRVVVTHFKPGLTKEIERELRRIRPAVSIARDGETYPLFR